MAHPPFRPAYTRLALRMLVANLFSTTALTLVPTLANANPLGGQVVAGSATIARPDPASVAVTQTSPKAVINWNSFSIGAGEQTTFVQPNAQAIALNRVVGVDPSKIMGTLKANGQVWLVNPNGIVFGKTAQVDVGGLLATTLDIGTSDFMAGNYKFSGPANSGAMVVNAGQITVNDAGLAALVAPGVENSGVITARLGKIQLASAAGFTVDLNGDGTFNFLLDKQVSQQLVRADGTTPSAAISNSGSLIADGGTILLTANAAKSVVDNAIDMSGYAQARNANLQGGTIILNGGNGTVQVSGTLDASAPDGGNGGFIETSAAHVHVTSGATVITTAPLGKTGTWLIDPHDYTIASSGGDITGAALSTQLASNNVTLVSSSGGSGTSGDINVNDAIGWSANTLTLTAANNINVNAVMTATGNASLALNPATANGKDAAVATGTVMMGMNSSGNFTGRVDFSGTGTLSISGIPYIVINSLGVEGDTSETTLAALQGTNGNLAGYYALGNNIDASGTSTWNGGAGFSPIGVYNYTTNVGAPFVGTFDGLGHTIAGLIINRPSMLNVGMFGFMAGTNSTVRNIGLTDVNVTGRGSTGGLVGYNGYNSLYYPGAGGNGGTINNSYVTGTVGGGSNSDTGGLVGYNNSGTVSNSYASGTVAGIGYTVGGLVGFNIGTISSVYATGTVTVSGSGDEYVGGLVGENSGTISSAYATGAVTGNCTAVGGLVGMNYYGTISNSYATGAVSSSVAFIFGGGQFGGLVGLNSDGTIIDSYATGAVTTSTGGVGGLVGVNENTSTVNNSYSTGAVSGGSGNFIGGLVGSNYGSTISNSYATGTVTASGNGNWVGGLAGTNNDGTISSAYAIGTVTASGTTVGGLVGLNELAGTITNGYWDTQTTGKSTTSGGGTGLTTAQLKSVLPTGFDPAVWTVSSAVNNGYPSLQWQAASTPTPTPTPVALTWSVADAFGTYGTLANFGALTLSGISSSDSGSVFGTLGLFSGSTAVTLATTTPAGTYSEEVTGLYGSAAGNYSLATSGDTIGTLVIAPKALTWSVTNASSTFGTTPTIGVAHLSGIVGSDNVNGAAGAFSGSTPVTLSTSTPAGSYTENVTGLSGSAAGNYTLASSGNSPGTLAVLAQTPTPTPGSGSGSNDATPSQNIGVTQTNRGTADIIPISIPTLTAISTPATLPPQDRNIWTELNSLPDLPTLSTGNNIGIVSAVTYIGGLPAGAVAETATGYYGDVADAYNLLNDSAHGRGNAQDVLNASGDILNTIVLGELSAVPGVSEAVNIGEQALTNSTENVLSNIFYYTFYR